MEKIVEQGLLYDFYGELLTKHQRDVYEDAVCHDMSLAELAEEYGISRQGVHDLLRRCDRILAGYEEKLQLVKKFEDAKKSMAEINRLAEEGKKIAKRRRGEKAEPEKGCAACPANDLFAAIEKLTVKMMENF